MEKPIIILDANAFISAANLLQLGASYTLVTTENVLAELRDVKTRDIIDSFPFTIQQMSCEKKSLAIVKDFARKTGDLTSLSDVDLELIALAHTLYIQNGYTSVIRQNPPLLQQAQSVYEDNEQEESTEQKDVDVENKQEASKIENDIETQNVEVNGEVNGEVKGETKQKEGETKQKEEEIKQKEEDEWIFVPKKNQQKDSSEEDNSDDDEQGWVTPQNFDKKMAEGTAFFKNAFAEDENTTVNISLMTSDFAMQNVAIQMGIELKSLDDRKITQVRRFILQCYLCWKQYKVEDNKVRLCKECGYNSLSKIAYSITASGQMVLYRKRGWKPNQKVMEWKERKFEEEQKKRKHQHARRRKQPSIFDA